MKNSKELHIVSFNIPYPANYGGVIDVFHKLVALNELGVKIHLHCFKYGRKESKILEKYCQKVYYYNRKMTWKNLFSPVPFITKSRESETLIHRLSKTPFPILLEGLHCTEILHRRELKNHKVFVRTHNVETDYYKLLAKNEANFFKKIYLYIEYLKVERYEKRISNSEGVFTISRADQEHFKKISKSYLIKAFHSNPSIQSKVGSGDYALYHGNLTVSENENAALFLINEVFSKLNYNFIIAGKKASYKLQKACQSYSHIQLINSPKDEEMDKLIIDAHMILLPTQQNTGIKLKLIESLYKGRFCIANDKMITGTDLESYCLQAKNSLEWIKQIKKTKDLEFTKEYTEQRQSLCTLFNNKIEAQKMIDVIFA